MFTIPAFLESRLIHMASSPELVFVLAVHIISYSKISISHFPTSYNPKTKPFYILPHNWKWIWPHCPFTLRSDLLCLQRGLLCRQGVSSTYRGASYASGVSPMHTEGPLYIQRGLAKLKKTLCTESTEGPPVLIEGPPIHCLQRCLQYPQRDYDTYRGLLCQEGPPRP